MGHGDLAVRAPWDRETAHELAQRGHSHPRTDVSHGSWLRAWVLWGAALSQLLVWIPAAPCGDCTPRLAQGQAPG